MDPITHFMTGACLARAGFNRKTAYATLTMTLAAEAPDIDMVGYLGGPVAGFAHHRGITHTFVGAPFMALAVTGVVWCLVRWRGRRRGRRRFGPEAAGTVPSNIAASRRVSGPPLRWFTIWLLALVADLSHLLLDYTNSYGLRPFFPFNPHWYAWSIMPIVSPVMLTLLLLGLAVPALLGLVEGEMRRHRRRELPGRGWAIAALVGIALLYTGRAVEQTMALGDAAAAVNPAPLRMAAVPKLINPGIWHVLEATRAGYQTAAVHTGSASVDARSELPTPPVTRAVQVAKTSLLGRVYMDWSSWPVVQDLGATPPPGSTEPLPPGATTVRFSDLRFAPAALGRLDDGAGAEGQAWPLSGFVVVGADGGVIGQWMGGSEQR